MILLLGCLDRLLESPYVLTAGLGDTRSLTVDRDGSLLAATATGVWRVARDGTATLVHPGSAQAVTLDPAHLYRLERDRIVWEQGGIEVPPAVDLSATWFDELWVLSSSGIIGFNHDFTGRDVVVGLSDTRALALGPPQEILLLTASELWALTQDGQRRSVATGLVDAIAAGTDEKGRIYVLHGTDRALFRVDGPALTLIARHLEGTRDIQFGVGPNLPHDFVYLARSEGRVDYVPVPP